MALRILLTGASGMVGEGVLLALLERPEVQSVTYLGRRTSGHRHPKLTEVLTPDLAQLNDVRDRLQGFDACFFCAGISSIGMSEADFTRSTYDLTLSVAHTLLGLNPHLVFTYVSGAGTDSSENGRLMWARVKGRTENALSALPFRGVYHFRPGFMKTVPGQIHANRYYKYFRWLYPVLMRLAPNTVCTLDEVARAMLQCVAAGYPKRILEVKDIRQAARAEENW
ncbi:NAD-dependent epimerase/dehydratase family protein [Flaviaesturariibacter aridisoli]|uniref:NAD-dependent epimerase/dehydratase family protein n=1 Tax=Flaviaesturariibacter aridisoli TaxID=2545761 RepID=A0A4R4DV78_9BACT|nr:NAD-dependent epimerase/dehydratase family protein [Flaviaesturariibacter aridisoli]TCZ67045.1 NAD-dependent epimerase/dehydratase family protein [Flaviaesturariibacter aridisoli]